MKRAIGVGCVLVALGCVSAGHRVQRLAERTTAVTGRCEHPPLHETRGPDRERNVLGVVTAECGRNSEAECRRELERGACALQADALIEVSNRPSGTSRRMVGTAVEYRDGEGAGGGSGGGSDAGTEGGESSGGAR